MSSVYIVKPNQCMCDVVLNALGTMEGAYAVCEANDMPLSASVAQGTLSMGQEIIIPDVDAEGNAVPRENANIAALQGDGVVIGTDMRLVCGVVVGLGQSGPSTITTIGIILTAGISHIPNPGVAVQVTINTVDAVGSSLVGLAPTILGGDLCAHTFTGLTSATTYYIYARTVCDAGSTASGYSGWVKLVANTA